MFRYAKKIVIPSKDTASVPTNVDASLVFTVKTVKDAFHSQVVKTEVAGNHLNVTVTRDTRESSAKNVSVN